MCRSHGWSMGCRWAEWNACLSYMSLHWAAQQMGQSDGCDYIYKWGIYSIILLSVSVCYRSCHRHRQRQTQPDRFAKTFSSFSSEIFVDASTVDSSMPMKIYCREWQGNVHVFAILCGDRRPMTEGEKRTCCAQHWRVWENNSPRLCISNKVHLSRLCIWRERKLRHRIIVNFPFKFYLANALVLFFLLSFIVCSRCIYIWFCFFCARKIRNCIVFCIFLKVKLFIFLFIFVCAACVFWNSQYRLYRYNVDGQNNPIVWCFTCRAHSQACILLQLKEMQKHADKRRLWLGVARATFSGIVGPLQQWDGIRMIFRRCVLLMQRHPAIAIRLMIPRLVDIFSIPIHILIVDSQRNKTTY